MNWILSAIALCLIVEAATLWRNLSRATERLEGLEVRFDELQERERALERREQ